MNPLVSIIIPTYNRAYLISATLDSILAQTYKNWECIIVDDGSTDNTVDVVNQYVKKDCRFQLHFRPDDRLKGGNAARNYGFEVSKGEYINWFDSDDLMVESLLKMKIDLLNKDVSLEFVTCGFKMFKGNDFIENNKWIVNNKEDIYKKFISKEILLNTPVIMWKRDKIQDLVFDENLTRAQDLFFIFNAFDRLLLKFEIIKLPLVSVRIHEQTISSSYSKGKKKDVTSELMVRKSILRRFAYDEDINFKKKNQINYLNTLKYCLETKNYCLFFCEILTMKNSNFILKTKLFFIGILFACSNRGLSYYSKIVKKYN